MAKTFRCSIVTPEEAVFDGEVVYASFPAWDGQRGMMAGQSPLLTRLGFGSLRLDFPPPDGGSRWFLIEGGFAQVQSGVNAGGGNGGGGSLTLLTEGAIPAERLSEQEANAELAEANARVAKPGEDMERVQRDQQRAMAKRTLARAAAGRGGAI